MGSRCMRSFRRRERPDGSDHAASPGADLCGRRAMTLKAEFESAPAVVVMMHGWGGNGADAAARPPAARGWLCDAVRRCAATAPATTTVSPSLPRFAEDTEHAFAWLRTPALSTFAKSCCRADWSAPARCCSQPAHAAGGGGGQRGGVPHPAAMMRRWLAAAHPEKPIGRYILDYAEDHRSPLRRHRAEEHHRLHSPPGGCWCMARTTRWCRSTRPCRSTRCVAIRRSS